LGGRGYADIRASRKNQTVRAYYGLREVSLASVQSKWV
jgi:hypothetical protein